MNKYLTESDIEKPRSPSELAKWFKLKYEAILADPAEKQNARCQHGLYKYFIQEIYPLMLYVNWRYELDDVLCQPKVGNQGFDATIWPQSDPKCIHNLEVTWPHNGKDSKEIAQAMNSIGYHFRNGDEFVKHTLEILQLVIKTAEKKSLKDYRNVGGSTLLIAVDTSCTPVRYSDRKAQLSELAIELRKIQFRVGNVYLVATPNVDIIPVIDEDATDV